MTTVGAIATAGTESSRSRTAKHNRAEIVRRLGHTGLYGGRVAILGAVQRSTRSDEAPS
jgi:hypothetical protein